MLSGGLASNTIDSGGADIVLAGVANGARISSGGTEVASSGGTLLSTTVLPGGVQYVLSGGVASGTIDSGGADIILAGGTASGTRVSSGFDVVSSGGISLSATVLNGGVEYALSGGVASGTMVNGGNEQVLSGGIASATTVSNGGFLVVSAGGTLNGATISGATLEIASGGLTGASPITYAGAAALILDASRTFSGTVAGFAVGDFLDLRDISFISGTTSVTFSEAAGNTSGMLTVSDGTHIANLTLLGQYVTAQFHVTSDGHGGTVVTDPPLATTTDANTGMFANPHHT